MNLKLTLSSIILTFTLLATHCRAEAQTATAAKETVSQSPDGEASAKQAPGAIVPVDVARDGYIVAIQATTNAPSWVFYQDRTGGQIVTVRVSGPFSSGVRVGSGTIVPTESVLYGTPLAVTQQNEGPNDPGVIQLFFFDRNHILSEVRWTKEGGWIHGTKCPGCIDQNVRYQAVYGSKLLYAIGTAHPQRKAGIRVGFQSASYPDTITEADRYGTWSLAPLRDGA